MTSFGWFQKGRNKVAPRGQRLLTFATKNDWEPVLSSLEKMLPVKYVESGMFSDPDPPAYDSFRELPRFGEAVWGNAVGERTYLIVKKDAPIYSRSVRLSTGGTRYVTDHENNPESVIFSPGGILQDPKAVISGETSKLSRLPAAEEIFQALSKLIKGHFPAVGEYRVGEEARFLGSRRYRLTASIRSPVEYDLCIC